MLEVTELCKGYKRGRYVVQDIDMHITRGTVHGLIGHNGSGKTTIIKCLTGICPPDAGEIRLEGQPVYENPQAKRKIGYVPDSNYMFENYRVSQMVKLYKEIFPDFSVTDFDSLNRMFEVDVKKRVSQLSKGQTMRVSFMLNMARNPELLILDEPTSGLDAMAKQDLLDTLVSAVENKGLTVLISSHHLDELEKVCDAVTMIRNGRLYMEDAIDEVTGRIVKYQVVFPDGAPAELYHRKDILHMSNVGSVYTVVLPQNSREFAGEMKKAGAVLVETMPVGLEESFIHMNRQETGGENDDRE